MVEAGWDVQKQLREEGRYTNGRIYVNGRLAAREKETLFE